MDIRIKYKRFWGFLLILISLVALFLLGMLYQMKGNIYMIILFSPILLIAILIGGFYIFEEYAITIKDNRLSTGYGLSKLSFEISDIVQIIPDQKITYQIIIVLKDKPTNVIFLNGFSRIINLVARTKINSNAIRLYDYMMDYDLKELEKELREEVEKTKSGKQ